MTADDQYLVGPVPGLAREGAIGRDPVDLPAG